ncbi:hypothetical protein ACVMHZ_000527 [Bradyrhizobium liaoningense]
MIIPPARQSPDGVLTWNAMDTARVVVRTIF